MNPTAMKNPHPPIPADPGAYALLIHLESPETIQVGKLGAIDFPAGWYVYVGSALNGLAARVNRHLRRNKKLHWHVDYLLQKGRISQVIWALSQEKLECRIAETLQHSGFSAVQRFGASDCRCPSHLFHSPTANPLRNEITRAFTSLNTPPNLHYPHPSTFSQ